MNTTAYQRYSQYHHVRLPFAPIPLSADNISRNYQTRQTIGELFRSRQPFLNFLFDTLPTPEIFGSLALVGLKNVGPEFIYTRYLFLL